MPGRCPSGYKLDFRWRKETYCWPKPKKPKKSPKWLQNAVGAEITIKKADLAWFKRRIQDARGLLKKGRILDASVFLDAVASLPAGFRPSVDEVKTGQLLALRMQTEMVEQRSWFKRHGIPEVIGSQAA
jgi:hypothetical protein